MQRSKPRTSLTEAETAELLAAITVFRRHVIKANASLKFGCPHYEALGSILGGMTLAVREITGEEAPYLRPTRSDGKSHVP